MNSLNIFLNSIWELSEETWKEVFPLFTKVELSPGDFFVKENVYAKKIAFLEEGIIRAFFTNKEAKEYNKQFFVNASFIGAYSSLLTNEKNKIPQQALSKCILWEAKYSDIKKLFKKFHDFEKLGRKIAEFYCVDSSWQSP